MVVKSLAMVFGVRRRLRLICFNSGLQQQQQQLRLQGCYSSARIVQQSIETPIRRLSIRPGHISRSTNSPSRRTERYNIVKNFMNTRQPIQRRHTFVTSTTPQEPPLSSPSTLTHHDTLQSNSSSQSPPPSMETKQTSRPDYWTNDGIIEGVWIFTRHGDRTPSRPLTPDHRRAEEAAYWMTKLPTPDSYAVFQSFSKYFPVSVQQPCGVKANAQHPHIFRDVALNPFGFITSKGLQQLADNGQRFYNRYNMHGHHVPQYPVFRTPKDFLTIWDVQVYSTNYLRTVMSIQSFLDGLFNTQCYYHPTSSSSGDEHFHVIEDRIYNPTITKEVRIPSISTMNNNEKHNALATINVRDIYCDPLNAFDRNPTLIAELVSEVMSTPDFLTRDGKATSLAARLANILPGLVRKSKKTTNDFSKHAPSRINWVEAADHFICRAAHDLSLSKFSDYETQEEYEQTLQAMSYTTLAHLSWRFRKWYQHERLLAVIAAPPLREITNQILETPHLSMNARRPFVLYSCHDITILGLLYAIGADFLAFNSSNTTEKLNHTSGDDTGSWRYWPSYGSHLVFELVRVRDGPPGPDSHVIRVLLDGVPIRSSKIEMSSLANHPKTSHSPKGMFFINDFEQLVSKLEQAGGHDYASLLGKNNRNRVM